MAKRGRSSGGKRNRNNRRSYYAWECSQILGLILGTKNRPLLYKEKVEATVIENVLYVRLIPPRSSQEPEEPEETVEVLTVPLPKRISTKGAAELRIKLLKISTKIEEHVSV